MTPAAPLPNELQRLAALRGLQVLDSPAETEFDALVRAASLVCEAPIALLSLVDEQRQWFKANIGLPGVSETHRDLAFCAHAIHGDQVFEVPDALQDARFADNPLVTQEPHIRFYAGAPVQLSDGSRIGTICVIDRQPRQISDTQRQILMQLAIAASRALEARQSEILYRAQQRQVQENEARQREMYEATPSMHYSIDVAGKFLAVSNRMAEFLGYQREELLGRSPADFMTPESRQRAQRTVFPEFLRTGESHNVPYQLLRKSGEVRDVLISAILVRDAQGQPLHSLSTVEDVTGFLRAERELQAERLRLSNIVNGTGAGTWEHNFVTGITLTNETYASMLGYSADEMRRFASAYFHTLVHPEDLEPMMLRWKAHLEGRAPEYQAEFRLRHKQGHWVWIQSRGRVGQQDADGRVTTISGIHIDVSERRQTIEVATRALHDLQNTLDALPSMVVYVDRDLRYRFANRAYGERYGIDSRQLPGRAMAEVVPPELYLQNLPLLQAALAGQEQRFERDVLTREGPRYSVVRYLPDQVDGEVRGLYMFLVDITELKQAQNALVLERERLESIVEGTHAGTWQLNLQTGEARINARWAEIAGFSLEELQDLSVQGWESLVHGDDLARVHRSMQDHVKGQTAYYECEYRMRHSNRQWLWVQDRGKISSRSADGRVEWISGTHLDVTARVLAEQQLSEQLKFVEVLLEATPTAIYIKDAQGRYLRFNPAFERLFGVSRDAWMGRTVLELVGGESGQMMYDKDLELFATGQPQTYEARFTHRVTGEVREGLYYKAALTNEHGVITGLVGTILDITERNQAARELEHAKAVAEAATVAKSQFLANMSHELRTPMNAVLGMLKLLQATELTARQLDYASKTESAARSLLGLLNDILDFSKMEAGKMQLDLHPYRMDRLLRDLAVVLSSTVGSKPVEVLYDIEADLPEVVVGDSMRLRQVLINLGGNAVKFTEKGQVVVSVRRVAAPAGGASETFPKGVALEFAVTDSGIGIPLDAQKHIFSGFSQAEASTTRRFGGTGLGLTISQRLVELMGGSIGLDSSPGRGSRFSFVVPLVQPEVIPDELKEAKSAPGAMRRVLVVDDNALSRELIAQTTRSWGWPTDTADGGADALARVEQQIRTQAEPWDVIYVDWQMPGLDGWDVMARIRAMTEAAAQPRPKIIMVTANGRESLAQRTQEEQAMLDGFLVKPVTASMLLDAVVDASPDHLGLRQVRRASKRQLAGMRILVVEDNLINQQVAEELLISEGALVSLAADGQQGVHAVLQAAEPYHAVLMDIQMPVLDGYAATREIRRQVPPDRLPIIGLTANAMESDRELCLQAGMNDHMGKPFDLAPLVSLLIRLTHFRPDPGEVALPSAPTPEPPARAAGQPLPAGAIDGEVLDLPGALQRMSGMQSLYIRAAQEFLRTLGDLPDTLLNHLQARHMAEARALLHTTKGTSATMGLQRLSKVCAEMEAMCRAGDAPGTMGAIAQRLQPEMQAARAELVRALAHWGVTPPDPAAAAQQAASSPTERPVPRLSASQRAALQGMVPLLQASDLSVLGLFSGMGGTLRSLPEAWFDALDQALAQLDLAQALEVCQTLLDSSKVP